LKFLWIAQVVRFTFPQQLFVKWQWLCSLQTDYYKHRTASHCRLTLDSHRLHSSPIPSSSFQAFEWAKLPQTNRHITFSQLRRHRPEPPWRWKQYVLPKHRNTPSIGQQTHIQPIGVTRPQNTTLTQHKDMIVLCCWSHAGWSALWSSDCYSKIVIFVSLRFHTFLLIILTCLFVFGATAPPPAHCPGPPHSRGFWITHNDAPQSVGIVCTDDQLVAQNSTRQHTTLTTTNHTPDGNWTHNRGRRAAAHRPYLHVSS